MLCHAVLQIPGHALGACKEAITKSATDALHAYRKQVSRRCFTPGKPLL